MNYTQSISVFLFTLSFCCNAAELQNNHRSIPFNRDVVGEPYFIHYNTDKDFIIGGMRGLQIESFSQKDLSKFTTDYHLFDFVKDDKAVIAFTKKDIVIVPFHKAPDTTISMREDKHIKCIAVDPDKNTMFIAYHDYLNKRSGITQYNNYLNPYMKKSCKDFNYRGSNICSMALSSNKDLLYVLTLDTISVFNTHDLASVVKQSSIFIDYPSSVKICNNKLVVHDAKSIYMVDINNDDSIADPHVLKQYPSYLESSKKIETIAFHPSGLLAALVRNLLNGGTIHYWDIATGKKVDKTVVNSTARDFCFNSDGCKVAIAFDEGCIEQPVSLKVIKQYVLLPLWMKLKTIQKQCNLPQDIMVQCMNAFMHYSR